MTNIEVVILRYEKFESFEKFENKKAIQHKIVSLSGTLCPT